MNGPRQLEAIIFDMDGVLVDSEPLFYEAVNEILVDEGSPALPRAEYPRYLGVTATEMWQDLIDRRWVRTRRTRSRSDRLVEYLCRFDAVITDAYRTRACALPGVERLLETLVAMGMDIAVASSSPIAWVDACLDALDIAEYFDVAVGGDMVARGKPDPGVFLLASQKLGVDPESCLVIEDSPKGITGALLAGMATVAVDTPYTTRAMTAHAHIQVRSLQEVEAVIHEPPAPWVP